MRIAFSVIAGVRSPRAARLAIRSRSSGRLDRIGDTLVRRAPFRWLAPSASSGAMIARLGRMALLLWLVVLSCLGLAACGDLPEPFLGNPGANARRLAQPLTSLLAVPPGTNTLLPNAANQELAKQIAVALQATEVPAMVRTPEKTDWRLITTAERNGDYVVPLFSVQDP